MRLLSLFAPLLLVGCADKSAPKPIADPPAVLPPKAEPEPEPELPPGVIPPPRPVLRDYDPTDGTLALEGRKLFLKLQCVSCHSADPSSKGPVLEGLYGTMVALKGGGATLADDNYIAESIRRPRAQVVEGWEAIMPAYGRDQVSGEELTALVAYIRSLKKGDTKKENFPSPNGAPTEPK